MVFPHQPFCPNHSSPLNLAYKQTDVYYTGRYLGQSPGFSNNKANAEGYPRPSGYDRQQDGQSFIPDVAAQQFEQRSYFEVVLKTTKQAELMAKLKLLHQLTLLGGGQLYLLAPKGHLPFTKSVAAESRIEAEWMTLG